MPAMENTPMFFRQIIEAFLVRTEPASSMAKPAAIHITSTPQIKNANVLRMNWAETSVTSLPPCWQPIESIPRRQGWRLRIGRGR